MKLANVIVVGLVVMLGILGLMLACYVVADGVDPCPKTTTKSSQPCNLQDDGAMHDNCNIPNCNGAFTAYSADTKNTGYQSTSGETYTTSVSYDAPASYKCATVTICELNSSTQKCNPKMYEVTTNGKLYSVHNCE